MDEIEIQWQSYQRRKDALQVTEDGGATWATVLTRMGDGSLQSYVEQINPAKNRLFRILQDIPEGSEPMIRAIVSWDGSGVTLEWNKIGLQGRFEVYRDGQLRQTFPFSTTNYRDTAVSSGQTYEYSVKWFPT